MNKQVLSVEQMQHLQELGLDISNASLYYYKQEGWEESYFMALACDVKEKGGLVYYYDSFSNKEYILNEVIPAYTFQDVLDALPLQVERPLHPERGKYELRIKRMVFDNGRLMYAVVYEKEDYIDWFVMQSYETLIDAAYEMLVWCIKQGYVEMDKNE